jgi:hypothetical protein
MIKKLSLIMAIFLCSICVSGCIYIPDPIYKNITVKDRVMTNGFGSTCGCSIATTDNEAYSVQYYTSCALLSPKTNATVEINNGRACSIEEVKVIP